MVALERYRIRHASVDLMRGLRYTAVICGVIVFAIGFTPQEAVSYTHLLLGQKYRSQLLARAAMFGAVAVGFGVIVSIFALAL